MSGKRQWPLRRIIIKRRLGCARRGNRGHGQAVEFVELISVRQPCGVDASSAAVFRPQMGKCLQAAPEKQRPQKEDAPGVDHGRIVVKMGLRRKEKLAPPSGPTTKIKGQTTFPCHRNAAIKARHSGYNLPYHPGTSLKIPTRSIRQFLRGQKKT